MRIVFMGTPEAAVLALMAVARRFEVVGVYTKPDRPRGRGRRLAPPPVKEAALGLGLSVEQPATLRGAAQGLASLCPDAILVVAYGLIIPRDVLAVPPLGCVNVHFSLLPRWRGAAPVERAILAGDERTGVTTMLMDEGLDTGPILLQEELEVAPDDTTGSLRSRLAALGAELSVRTLEGLAAGTLRPRPQPLEGVTLAPKITPEETVLDLRQPAEVLERRVRAMNPDRGAVLHFGGRRLKVWRASVVEGEGEPGTFVPPCDVQTARGRLRLVEVQPEGRRRMSGEDFVRGWRPRPGERVP